jgi:thymidine phosphorylase
VKHIYEITAAGFDGSTDETDDHVIWVSADSEQQVRAAIQDTGAKLAKEIEAWVYRRESLEDLSDCIDFTLPEQTMNLTEALLNFASDERNKNRA